MFTNVRLQLRRPEELKTPLAVVGAVTAGFLGAKLLRQALIWAQYTLAPPVVRQYAGEWALITGGTRLSPVGAVQLPWCNQWTNILHAHHIRSIRCRKEPRMMVLLLLTC